VKQQWYCRLEGQQTGPYTAEELKALAAEGRIGPQTEVRREADKKWFQAAKVSGLVERPPPSDPVRASAAAPPVPPPAPADLIAPPPVAATPPPPPVALAAAGQSPLGIVVAPPVLAKNPDDAPLPAAARPGASPLLAAVAVGVVLALVVVVVCAIGWRLTVPTSPTAEPLAKAEKPAAPPEEKPVLSEAELDAILGPKAPEPPPQPAKSAKDAAVAAESAADDPKLAAARKIVAAQAGWTNIENLREIKVRGRDMSLRVTAVWLTSDTAGTRVEPTLPAPAPPAGGQPAGDAKSPPASSAAPAGAASAATAKYVFVELRVTNSGSVPRKYQGWNSGDAASAILADKSNQVLAFVPPSQTPGFTRLAAHHLPAGKTVSDLLVFEAPDKPFESLRLALAQSGLVETLKGHFAFEVPIEFLFRTEADMLDDDAPRPAVGGKPGDQNAPPPLDGRTLSEFEKAQALKGMTGAKP
jgi:hypothetical protein